jgi:hypothetical protein
LAPTSSIQASAPSLKDFAPIRLLLLRS